MKKKSKRASRKRNAELERKRRGSPAPANKHNRLVKADLSKQVANNSYGPPTFYKDYPFTCEDCGVKEIWTADQQKQYYEEWKNPIYGNAVRCRACRKVHSKKKQEQRERSMEGLKKKSTD